MDRLPKLLFLSLILCGVMLTAQDHTLHASGRYFIYNDNTKMIFGSGDIVLRSGATRLRGEVLYYDAAARRGILYGGPTGDTGESPQWDIAYFRGVPPEFHFESLGERIASGGTGTQRFQLRKPTLEELRDNAIYFEFREFSVDPGGRIRARTVIPYIMGMPSMPMRKFTVNRGSLEDRNLFYIEDLHYTRTEGLAVDTRLHLHLRPLHGEFLLKGYERELFHLEGIRRGLLYSGKLALRSGKKDALNLGLRGNTGDGSFNLTLSRTGNMGLLEYSISQHFSGRSGSDPFSEFQGRLAIKPFTGFNPQLFIRYNWKESVTYKISAPLEIKNRLRLKLGLERRILREGYNSDQMELSAEFGFQGRWFSLDSGFRLNRDMLEKISRRNFSVQVPFTPLHLAGDSLTLAVTPFYMFNSFPSGAGIQSSSSPGIRMLVHSAGLKLPLGFVLRPGFAVNHIWDGLQDDMTDFQSELALTRRMGEVEFAVEYGLASRFLSRGFWVEGTHTRNLSVTGTYRTRRDVNLRLRMIMDNDLKPDTLTWNGQIRLPWDLRLSSFVIYYIRGERFQTVEVFLEKVVKRKLKIQGGYSFALKKFFFKLLLV